MNDKDINFTLVKDFINKSKHSTFSLITYGYDSGGVSLEYNDFILVAIDNLCIFDTDSSFVKRIRLCGEIRTPKLLNELSKKKNRISKKNLLKLIDIMDVLC